MVFLAFSFAAIFNGEHIIKSKLFWYRNIVRFCIFFPSFFLCFYRKGCSDFVVGNRSSQLSLFDSFLTVDVTADRTCLDTLVDSSGEPFRRCCCRCWTGDAIRSRSVRLKPLSLMTLHYLHMHRNTIIRWLCQLSARFLSRYLLSYYDIFPEETLQVYQLSYQDTKICTTLAEFQATFYIVYHI